MDTRARILSELKSAGGEGRDELPQSVPSFPRYEDPLERFRAEWESVGGVFLDARKRGIVAALKAILDQCAASRLHWENALVLQRHGIACSCGPAPRSIEHCLAFSDHQDGTVSLPIRIEWEERDAQAIDRMQVALFNACNGIAETGTVVHRVERLSGRRMNMMAPSHAALLRAGDLLHNHSDYFRTAAPGRLGSADLFITGPSRTADIEKQLILGVHGPRRAFVILTE